MSISTRALLVLALTLTAAFLALPEGKGFLRVGALTLNAGENRLSSAVIDSAAGFAYFGTSNLTGVNPALIVKIRLSDFTRFGAMKLDTGENIVSSAVIDPAGGYAYFGTTDSQGSSNPAIIVRIRLSDFTRAGSLTLGDFESYSRSALIDTASGFAYFGTNYGYLVKIRLSDFSRVGALYLSEAYPDAAVIDTAAGFAYFNMYSGTNNGLSAVKVSLSSFTIVDTISLGTGGCCDFSAVIDASAGFAYFDETGSVVKVRLSDFTYLGVLFLQPGGGAAVIDPPAGFAYFGRLSDIVKIRLADFTEVTRFTHLETESSASAVIDSAGGFAYFGTDSTPGSIVKVALGPYSRLVSNPTTMNVPSGKVTFDVRSNSTISEFQYSYYYGQTPGEIRFMVSGEGIGVANVTVPKSAVPRGGAITVSIDRNVTLTPQIIEDPNNYYVYISYHLSTHSVQIHLTPGAASSLSPTGIISLVRRNLPLLGGAILVALALVIGGIIVAVRIRRPRVHSPTPVIH